MNLHDHNIYKYEVLCKEKRILLHTESEGRKEQLIAQFSDVEAHQITNSLAGNIIFEIIEERDSISFYIENERSLLDYQKNGGLPYSFNGSKNFKKLVTDKELKLFYIRSSYGLSAWIIAKDFEIIRNEK